MRAPDEPRPVPFPETVHGPVWYCLECGSDRPSEMSINGHWKATHCDPPNARDGEKGVDYVEGYQLLLMQDRRKQWAAEEAARFGRKLHEGFTVDDFIAETEIADA